MIARLSTNAPANIRKNPAISVRISDLLNGISCMLLVLVFLPSVITKYFVASALATKYLVMTEGRKTSTRSIQEIPFSKSEILTLIAGFFLMLAGALVESRAIIG